MNFAIVLMNLVMWTMSQVKRNATNGIGEEENRRVLEGRRGSL